MKDAISTIWYLEQRAATFPANVRVVSRTLRSTEWATSVVVRMPLIPILACSPCCDCVPAVLLNRYCFCSLHVGRRFLSVTFRTYLCMAAVYVFALWT
jgi:hypothetical protein